MSKVGVKLKIDVSKIDKSLLFKGAKGVYLDATVFINLDEADQYDNNGMITQDETKENREGGKNGPILGNCKVFWKDGGQQSNARQPANKPAAKAAPEYDDFQDSDLPF
jgi:hypothetical protein